MTVVPSLTGRAPTRRPDGWLVRQLPVGLTDDDFFHRFVSLFEALSDSVLDGVDTLDHLLDTTVSPLPVVRYLATWLGMPTIDPDLPEELQRRLLQGAGAALQYRGTARGLTAYLRLLTGHEPVIEESGGVYRAGAAPLDAGHVRIRLDHTGGWLRDAHLRELIRDELPAHVSFELVVGGRQLWPPTPAEPDETGSEQEGEGES